MSAGLRNKLAQAFGDLVIRAGSSPRGCASVSGRPERGQAQGRNGPGRSRKTPGYGPQTRRPVQRRPKARKPTSFPRDSAASFALSTYQRGGGINPTKINRAGREYATGMRARTRRDAPPPVAGANLRREPEPQERCSCGFDENIRCERGRERLKAGSGTPRQGTRRCMTRRSQASGAERRSPVGRIDPERATTPGCTGRRPQDRSTDRACDTHYSSPFNDRACAMFVSR